jgi:hypothetical protein
MWATEVSTPAPGREQLRHARSPQTVAGRPDGFALFSVRGERHTEPQWTAAIHAGGGQWRSKRWSESNRRTYPDTALPTLPGKTWSAQVA